MLNYEEIAFSIISNAGAAKALIMESIESSEKKDFSKAQELLKEAKQYHIEAHKSHALLVQREASGESLEYSLLIVHAEDQLMNVELLFDMADKFKYVHERIE